MSDATAYGLRLLARSVWKRVKAWAVLAWEWINKRIPHG